MIKDLDAGRPDRHQHWSRVFGDEGEADVSWFQEHPRISVELIGRTGAERSARVVDVGAGASRLVDELLDAGYESLTVVDIAAEALEKSRARVGARAERVTWVTSDVLEWAPPEPFDVWHDRAVFHFMVEPNDQAAYLATLHRALRVGGQAIVATFASDGPERCSGLTVQRYEPDALAAKLGPTFRLLETVREQHVTPAGKVQSFQYSRFERLS